MMMNQLELCLMATSGVAIAALFFYCNSGNGSIFDVHRLEEDKKENNAKRKRRKRAERRTTSQSTQLGRKQSVMEEEEEGEDQDDMEDGLVQKIENLEIELTEVKMKNLKMVKIQENLEEKLKVKSSVHDKKKILKDAQVGTEKDDYELQEAKVKLESLNEALLNAEEEKIKLKETMTKVKEEVKIEKEENKKLEKMLMEQQTVIRTALLRIFPKKQNKVSFCQEHLEIIRNYQDKSSNFRQECK